MAVNVDAARISGMIQVDALFATDKRKSEQKRNFRSWRARERGTSGGSEGEKFKRMRVTVQIWIK